MKELLPSDLLRIKHLVHVQDGLTENERGFVKGLQFRTVLTQTDLVRLRLLYNLNRDLKSTEDGVELEVRRDQNTLRRWLADEHIERL